MRGFLLINSRHGFELRRNKCQGTVDCDEKPAKERATIWYWLAPKLELENEHNKSLILTETAMET